MLALYLPVLTLPFVWPSANYPEDVVEGLPQELPLGVYYGWGNVDDGEVYKMVLSVGWNLYYKNTKKSMVSTKTPRSSWLVQKHQEVHG